MWSENSAIVDHTVQSLPSLPMHLMSTPELLFASTKLVNNWNTASCRTGSELFSTELRPSRSISAINRLSITAS